MNDSYESGVGNPWHWEPESSWSYYRPLPPYLESEYCNRVGVSPGSHGAEGFVYMVKSVVTDSIFVDNNYILCVIGYCIYSNFSLN